MALDFPSSPSVNDVYTVGARTWRWTGTFWELSGTSIVVDDGSITAAKLATDSVTTTKIVDGAVTQAKLDAGIELGVTDGSVTTAKIANNAVTTAKLAKEAIYLNSQTISADYNIPSGYNALSAGPITISASVTVTIPDGSSWSIV